MCSMKSAINWVGPAAARRTPWPCRLHVDAVSGRGVAHHGDVACPPAASRTPRRATSLASTAAGARIPASTAEVMVTEVGVFSSASLEPYAGVHG